MARTLRQMARKASHCAHEVPRTQCPLCKTANGGADPPRQPQGFTTEEVSRLLDRMPGGHGFRVILEKKP